MLTADWLAGWRNAVSIFYAVVECEFYVRWNDVFVNTRVMTALWGTFGSVNKAIFSFATSAVVSLRVMWSSQFVLWPPFQHLRLVWSGPRRYLKLLTSSNRSPQRASARTGSCPSWRSTSFKGYNINSSIAGRCNSPTFRLPWVFFLEENCIYQQSCY